MIQLLGFADVGQPFVVARRHADVSVELPRLPSFQYVRLRVAFGDEIIFIISHLSFTFNWFSDWSLSCGSGIALFGFVDFFTFDTNVGSVIKQWLFILTPEANLIIIITLSTIRVEVCCQRDSEKVAIILNQKGCNLYVKATGDCVKECGCVMQAKLCNTVPSFWLARFVLGATTGLGWPLDNGLNGRFQMPSDSRTLWALLLNCSTTGLTVCWMPLSMRSASVSTLQ